MREFARIWKEVPRIVVSRTLERVDADSRLVPDDAVGAVARLRAQPGFDMDVGGPTLASTLMRAGLIDEVRLFVQPVILGAGTRFFPALDGRIGLNLLETRAFGSGIVYLRYKALRPTGRTGSPYHESGRTLARAPTASIPPSTKSPEAGAMSELVGIARFDVQEGRVEEFKRLSAQVMEIVRTKETGTLPYDIYFNDDQSAYVVLRRYRDSQALIGHAAHLGDLPGQSLRRAPSPARSSVSRAQSAGPCMGDRRLGRPTDRVRDIRAAAHAYHPCAAPNAASVAERRVEREAARLG